MSKLVETLRKKPPGCHNTFVQNGEIPICMPTEREGHNVQECDGYNNDLRRELTMRHRSIDRPARSVYGGSITAGCCLAARCRYRGHPSHVEWSSLELTRGSAPGVCATFGTARVGACS